MSNRHLHIISFDIPFPPDYGGVIDVYFKIKALHDAGVKIHLHCFMYGRTKMPELELMCEEVFYYKRDKMWKGFLTDKPFIVQSRNAISLKSNLLKDVHPVLFEGLHCCYYLPEEFLRNRITMVRMHNDETKYYFDLAQREKKLIKKLYYFAEYRRLMKYERVLQFASKIFCISKAETIHFSSKFKSVVYLAPFHGNTVISSAAGIGKYILYHGNLGVNENHEAAMFLVEKVFLKIEVPCIIAGNNPSLVLQHAVKSLKNVTLIQDPLQQKMETLIGDAHINVLPTFQSTGIKLKLLNALFKGRFCIVNSLMVNGTGLEKYCILADDADTMISKIAEYMPKEFSSNEATDRKLISDEFSDSEEVKKIIKHFSQVPPQ